MELPVLACNAHIPYPLVEDGTLIDFMIGQILTQHYIYLFNLDEYYLDNTPNYEKRHLLHDSFIYGFDNDRNEFLTMSYDKNIQFNYNRLQYGSLVNSLTSEFSAGNSMLYTVRASDAFCPLDIHEIKSEMEQYLYNFNTHSLVYLGSDFKQVNDGWTYGIQFYEYIYHYIELIRLGKFQPEEIDIRIFRTILDRAFVMSDRIKKLKDIKENTILQSNIEMMIIKAQILLICR